MPKMAEAVPMYGPHDALNRIAVVGHSFVVHFEEFVRNDSLLYGNLGLDDTRVAYFGKGGLRLPQIDRFEDGIRSFSPHVIFLILGDNDLYESAPDVVADRVLQAHDKLKAWTGGAKIIMFSLFPRFWTSDNYYFTPSYNQDAIWVNETVTNRVAQLPRSFTWNCHGPSFTDRRASNYFEADGVHLKANGQVKIYQALTKSYHNFRQF